MNKTFRIVLAIIAVVLVVWAVTYSKNSTIVADSTRKTYTNDTYGYEFKYPSDYFVLTKNSDKQFVDATPLADSVFVTGIPAERINFAGKENCGLWITASDKASEPVDVMTNIVSKKTVNVDGNETTEYVTKNGMEGTEVKLVYFQKDGKYFRISEWSTDLLDSIIPTFKFTTPTPVVQKGEVIKTNLGISFTLPSEWQVVSNTDKEITLKQVGGKWIDDTIDITTRTGPSVTTKDAKFGDVTYYFDQAKNAWLYNGQSEKTGGVFTGAPAPISMRIGENPVFAGTTRWLTYILPLTHTNFLIFHITGSGNREPLNELMKSVTITN